MSNASKDPNVVKRRLAQTMHNKIQGMVDAKPGLHLSTVLSTNPLRVELHDYDFTLQEDEDLLVSQWVAHYDDQFGIVPEDNIIVHFIGGHWIAADVMSDTDVTTGT